MDQNYWLMCLYCLLWPNLDFLEFTSCLEKIFHQDLYASYFHLCLSIYMTVTWIFNRLEHKTKCYKNTTEGTEMEIIFKTWKIHCVCVAIGMYILIVKFRGLTLQEGAKRAIQLFLKLVIAFGQSHKNWLLTTARWL